MIQTPLSLLRRSAAALAVSALLPLTWGVSSQAQATEPVVAPLATVPTLDVPRYMGAWFEIAKYPNRFQRKCARNTTAEYALQGDGTVRVTNRCVTAQGDTIEAVGQARQIGAATSPKLEVRFAPAWLSFLPMVWGDYWVIDLDAAYSLVAISEPQRHFLWVLSRTPQVNAQAYEALLARLAQQGFDLSRLETTPQD